ncbi:MAG: DUF2202 domain-containing protein [Pelolinea sp.]|nr:DUF2202 domain-containing protein [Pelolinea sp.]
MKKYTIFLVLIIFASVISACSNTPEQAEAPQVLTSVIEEDQQVETANTTVNSQVSEYSAVKNGLLTENEVVGLLFMVEEEKLAHDVYMVLYDLWGQPIFQNIANSELSHIEAVKNLMERYGIPNTAESNALGQFDNQDLQALYDQLVEMGSVSLAEAIKVGTAVEEIDILDLEEYLTQTEVADLTLVYENLLAGSRNHLRSFVSTFERQTGEIFQPQYLSLAAFEEIMAGSFETGIGSGQQGGKGFENSTSTLTN